MKSNPWFSSEKKEYAYEHTETVHHNNTLCVEGEKIIKKHLKTGTDHRPLCKECDRLNAKEQ